MNRLAASALSVTIPVTALGVRKLETVFTSAPTAVGRTRLRRKLQLLRGTDKEGSGRDDVSPALLPGPDLYAGP